MYAKRKQSGLTLTEMAVVVGVIALLAGLALPTVRVVIESFESGDSAMSMISSALATARAMAARDGHYVGVRFQKAYNRNAADPLNPLTASQYMIFIVHDSSIMAGGYRVLEGTKPIKLPDSIGVMDMTIVPGRNIPYPISPGAEFRIDDPTITAAEADALIDEPHELVDTSAFSVIFSQSGKLVIQGVRVRRQSASDSVFNEDAEVIAGIGMFYQDDYFLAAGTELGLGPEPSRNRFLIYDRLRLRKAFEKGLAWSDYLAGIIGKTTYINPHTGTIISRK